MDRISIITSGDIGMYIPCTKDFESVVNAKIQELEEDGYKIVGIDYLSNKEGALKNVVLWYEGE